MTRQVARQIACVRAALGAHPPAATRRPADLLGRWALPSGAAFRVLYVLDEQVTCGNGAERWHLPLAQFTALLDCRQLRYLGRRGR